MFKRTCFVSFVLALFFVLSVQAQTVSKRITVSEDSYIFSNGGADDAILRQFDSPNGLKSYTHQSDEKWSYKTYLKFDLSTVSNNPDLIEKVLLKVVGREDQGSFSHKISVYSLSDNNWSEDELSYNTRSSVGNATKITTVTKTIGTDADKWFDFDITSVVKEYKASGKNTISLMLSDDTNVRNPENSQGSVVTFYSKEASGSNYPRLAVDEKDVSDFLLSDIRLNGTTIDGFAPDRYNYEIGIDPQWTQVPLVEYTASDETAVVSVTAARALTGSVEDRTATIIVTKGSQSVIYKITFGSSIISNDALLKSISVDGHPIEFFSSQKFVYKYFYPYTQTTAPVISFTGSSQSQEIIYTQPVNIFSNEENDRIGKINVTSGDKQSITEYTIAFRVLPKLDLYLCIGQSNMAGRGYMDASLGDNIPLENSYLFTPEFNFEEAVNPMNQYSNIRKELSLQQVSPAWGFAKYMNDNMPEIKTGMIVNARGGSAIEEWEKGQSLYEKTVERTLNALKWGELKGILWHQGESNSGSAKVEIYPSQLKSMVENIRTDLSSPNAYFLAGELIHTWSNSAIFNTMIQTIGTFLSNSDWVSADRLLPRASGDVHFDRAGNITLGERYAQKVVEKYYQSSISKSDSDSIIISCDTNGVNIKGLTSTSQISLYDLCGKMLFSDVASTDYSFQMSRKGMYLITIKYETNIVVRKIIVS
ncbi:MAG: sialate O-acetylesterase [Dysgonomonas sp.]